MSKPAPSGTGGYWVYNGSSKRLITTPDQGGYAVVMGTPDMSLNVGLDHHPTHDDNGFDPARTGLDHLCFQVADVGALSTWASHLDDHGITHSGVYPMSGMPISLLTFTDPDGIQLELIAFGS